MSVPEGADRAGRPDAATIERLRTRFDQCFACGQGNPVGLRLDGFAIDGAEVVAPFRPRPEYAGFEGVLHGGVVATALDEILAWSAVLLAGTFVYTGTLDLRYRRPAPAGASYELRGRIDDRRGRRFRLSGSMMSAGATVAEGTGIYLAKETVEATLSAGS